MHHQSLSPGLLISTCPLTFLDTRRCLSVLPQLERWQEALQYCNAGLGITTPSHPLGKHRLFSRQGGAAACEVCTASGAVGGQATCPHGCESCCQAESPLLIAFLDVVAALSIPATACHADTAPHPASAAMQAGPCVPELGQAAGGPGGL